MLYATWVTGAKSGGFDYRANNKGAAATMDQAFAFGDEKAMTWEAGVKTRLFGGRAEINAAAYYTSYKDLQVSVFDGRLGFNVGNAAKARIFGVELDGRVRISTELSASGSFAWTDFKFQKFPVGQCYSGQAPSGPAAAQGYCDYAGKRTQFVPKTTGTLALDYVHPISSALEMRLSADMFYTGNYYADPTLDPNLIQDAYARLNARLALASPNDTWELAVLAKNVTDKKPMTFATATPLGFSVFGARSTNAFFGEGRTFVLQGKVNF
jgi:outer membrane receptor protein involved in Fe transport